MYWITANLWVIHKQNGTCVLDYGCIIAWPGIHQRRVGPGQWIMAKLCTGLRHNWEECGKATRIAVKSPKSVRGKKKDGLGTESLVPLQSP